MDTKGPLITGATHFYQDATSRYSASACLTPNKSKIRVGLIREGQEVSLVLTPLDALKYGQLLVRLAYSAKKEPEEEDSFEKLKETLADLF